MDNFAPVLIPTLNRHVHFKRCVESLSKCTHAEKTDLFIALDYPLTETHWEGYEKIKAYIPRIKGFKSVQIIERQKNFGARENVQDARKMIFETYDRMIFSEDDNEFSPNFLDYINKGLDKYQSHQSVYSICGYNYPVIIPESYKNNFFLYKTISGWGVGYWKSKCVDFLSEINEIKYYLMKPFNAFKLFRHSSSTFGSLLRMLERNTIYGDTTLGTYLARHNKYCVFPTVSKVRNHGHDGTGVHCGEIKDSVYRTQEIDNNKIFEFSSNDEIAKENALIRNTLKKYFDIKFQSKIRIIIKYIEFILKNWGKEGLNISNIFASFVFIKFIKSKKKISQTVPHSKWNYGTTSPISTFEFRAFEFVSYFDIRISYFPLRALCALAVQKPRLT
jgi:hypothetical protein